MIKRSVTAAPDTVTLSFSLGCDVVDQPVSVVGEFNGWDPLAHPMKKRSNGTRSVKVDVEQGRTYRFKYLAADGSWHTDPYARTVDNGMAGVDSLVEV
jgi:1,4-alpha-glucan branching enzyme